LYLTAVYLLYIKQCPVAAHYVTSAHVIGMPYKQHSITSIQIDSVVCDGYI